MLVALLVLYVGSQLLSSAADDGDRRQEPALIMIALPFLFVPFIFGFPAGLIVYWITTNLWTIGQQYIDAPQARRRCAAAGAQGERRRAAPAVAPAGGERPPEAGRGEAAPMAATGPPSPSSASAEAPPPPAATRKKKSRPEARR